MLKDRIDFELLQTLILNNQMSNILQNHRSRHTLSINCYCGDLLCSSHSFWRGKWVVKYGTKNVRILEF